jgi:hypothetical protein
MSYHYYQVQQQQQQTNLLFPNKLGRLEMKPYKPKKNRYKTRAKKEKIKGDKETKTKNEKRQ